MKERATAYSEENEINPKPEYFLIDQDGEVYITTHDASKLSGLKRKTLRRLVWADRVDAVKPIRDLFISRRSLQKYLETRKKIGRPRKIPPLVVGKERGHPKTRHPLEESDFLYFRDPEGNYLVPMDSASEISGFSDGHLRGLAIKGRVEATKPGGRDWLFSYDSLVEYLDHGREVGGRPRKTSEQQNKI